MFTPKKITVITGHYGSGKTNFSAAFALELAKSGEPVTVVDFDLVNPYFRTADFAKEFAANGVKLIAPEYANTNVDIPSIQFDLGGLAAADGYLIIDVGGDDDGAVALGRFSHVLNSYAETNELDMLAVVSFRRYLTRTAAEAETYLRGIEQASRMKLTGIVNNTNLGTETTADMILDSIPLCKELSEQMQLPIYATTVPEFIEMPQVSDTELTQIPVMVKLPWNKTEDAQ